MIGVIILNYNTADDSIDCIKSIQLQTTVNYKIYVVDNASTEEKTSVLYDFCKNNSITFLRSEVNKGFSGGNNLGIKEAIKDGASYICLVNSDVIFENDVLRIMRDDFIEDSTLGVVAPSILLPSHTGEGQFARNKLTYGNYLAEKTFLGKIDPIQRKYPRYQIKDKAFADKYKFMGMVYGCCYMIRSTVIEKIDYLDEAVFLFGEEDILAYKLEAEGLYTLINPKAIIFHNHHNSLKRTSKANVHYHLLLSPLILLRKYAHINKVQSLTIFISDVVLWSYNSISDKVYRRLLGDFIKACYRNIK